MRRDRRQMINDLCYLYKQSRDWGVFDILIDEMDDEFDRIIRAVSRMRFGHFDDDDVKSELKLRMLSLIDRYDGNRGSDFYRYLFYNLGVQAKNYFRDNKIRKRIFESGKVVERYSMQNMREELNSVLRLYRSELSETTRTVLENTVWSDKDKKEFPNFIRLRKFRSACKRNRGIMNELRDFFELKNIKIA